jgi:hypothetical protein
MVNVPIVCRSYSQAQSLPYSFISQTVHATPPSRQNPKAAACFSLRRR